MLIDELLPYRQWVTYRADKVPLRIVDGDLASSTNPADWTDYNTAAAFVAKYPEFGLGFVLTDNDPFTVIDLDSYRTKDPAILANHAEIFKAFSNTYVELSPSGGGAHIWCKGRVETRKFTEQYLEVYSTAHYMTVTGKPVVDLPTIDCQQLLDELVASIDVATNRRNNTGSTVDLAEVFTDNEIITKAAQASNGEMFKQLYQGNWQGLFPSQSEADLTLCNMIAFYTDNQRQVGRIFLNSPLLLTSPKRKRKERSDYLYHEKYGIVKKAFDQKIPPVDISAITAEWEHKQQQVAVLKPIDEPDAIEEYQPDSLAPAAEHWQKPTGLLGDIAEYIYSSAVLPNIEVALAGAITFMAGICGRSYNTTTGTGLNQYIVLLAGTGQGKEAAARGMSRLLKAVQRQVPGITQFAGPSEIASSQALLKFFAETNCFWSHKNEFGFWLQKMNHKYAKANELTLKAMLLDLYHKSGFEDILMGSIYSDKKNNAPMVKAPALTLFGESTPEEFYKAVDEANIAEGLISRLTMIPVPDVRPPYNPDAGGYAPPDALVWRIAGMVKRVLELEQVQQCLRVPETSEANEYQLKYQKLCMDRVWANRTDITSKIWQRAHIRLLRMGALLAVGNNPDNPCVTVQDYEWSKKLIDYGAIALKKRFESGMIGEGSAITEQRIDLKRFLVKYANEPWSDVLVKKYRVTFDMWQAKAIPFAAIYQRVACYTSFRKDPHPSLALNNVLREFEQAGYIVKADAMHCAEWKKRGAVYCVTGDIQ